MLSNHTVKNARPGRDAAGKPRSRKLADSYGLYLFVSKKGARSFRYDYRFNGRRRTVTFSLYSALSVKAARDRHDAARRLLASGVDPAAKKRQDRREAVKGAANTIRAIAEDWYSELAPHKSKS